MRALRVSRRTGMTAIRDKCQGQIYIGEVGIEGPESAFQKRDSKWGGAALAVGATGAKALRWGQYLERPAGSWQGRCRVILDSGEAGVGQATGPHSSWKEAEFYSNWSEMSY